MAASCGGVGNPVVVKRSVGLRWKPGLKKLIESLVIDFQLGYDLVPCHELTLNFAMRGCVLAFFPVDSRVA